MIIKLKQYFRGRLTNEQLLHPETYDTDTLAPELVEHLLTYGYAEIVHREPIEEFANGESENKFGVTGTANLIQRDISPKRKR